MSLRWRLVISLVLVVAAVASVGFVAFEISGHMQTQVGHLSRRSGVSLTGNPERQTLEIEGSWSAGVFVAREIDRLPGSRRPKLRGTIEMLDAATGRLGLFGLVIHVDPSTEYAGASLQELTVGMRAEISCKVDPGNRWLARRIRTGDVKPNDKIKGTITRYQADGVWPDTLQIHDLSILVGQDKHVGGERTQLHRIGSAAELGIMLRQIDDGSRKVALGDDSGADDLRAVASDFEQAVADLFSSAPIGSDEKVSWLNDMMAGATVLRNSIDALLEAAATQDGSALEYHEMKITPMVRDRILPLVDAYRLDAEEELADQVIDLVSDAQNMKNVILITTVAAVGLALLLGIGLWRAISGPLLALSTAARRIGSGHLDTRVDEPATGELGEVARSFNTMAEELASSTVSIEKLNVVRDELRQSLAERDLLLKEIHHRVKNNLQIVSSLLDLQSGLVTDTESLELFKESRDRIRSMALIHEQLYRSTDLGQIDFQTYIELLVEGLVSSLGCDGRVEFRLELESVHLDVDRSVACGLILNELVTNSIKHAFTETQRGEVTIGFHAQGENYEMIVADNGRGLREDWSSNSGSLGFELVSSLSGQLGGTLDFDSDSGTRARLVFPSETVAQEALP